MSLGIGFSLYGSGLFVIYILSLIELPNFLLLNMLFSLCVNGYLVCKFDLHCTHIVSLVGLF